MARRTKFFVVQKKVEISDRRRVVMHVKTVGGAVIFFDELETRSKFFDLKWAREIVVFQLRGGGNQNQYDNYPA